MRLFHLLLACLLASPAAAADLFVNNITGSDVYSGDIEQPASGNSGPLRSISEALRRSRARDRIVLANTDTPYRESLSLSTGRHCGDSLRSFVIVGNGAILDGSLPTRAADWTVVPRTNAVFRYRPPRMAYQQLFMNDLPVPRVPAANQDAGPPQLQPLHWCLYQGDIYFRTEPNKWIDAYPLSVAVLPVGITLYKVRHVIITDLIVQGYQLDGINTHDTSECTLIGITCRGNGRSGVAAVGAARLSIERSLLGDNAVAQVISEGYAKTRILDSRLLDNTAPAILRRGGEVLEHSTEATVPEQSP